MCRLDTSPDLALFRPPLEATFEMVTNLVSQDHQPIHIRLRIPSQRRDSGSDIALSNGRERSPRSGRRSCATPGPARANRPKPAAKPLWKAFVPSRTPYRASARAHRPCVLPPKNSGFGCGHRPRVLPSRDTAPWDQNPATFSLGSLDIPFVETVRILGIRLSRFVQADAHARTAALEAKKEIQGGRFLTPALRMTLFLNTIGSKLLYGIEAWWPNINGDSKDKLSSALASLARLFIVAHKTASGDSCVAEAGMWPLAVWVTLRSQVYDGKLRCIDPDGPNGFLSRATPSPSPPPSGEGEELRRLTQTYLQLPGSTPVESGTLRPDSDRNGKLASSKYPEALKGGQVRNGGTSEENRHMGFYGKISPHSPQ